MFREPGKKLKTVAKIWFVLSSVGILVLAVLLADDSVISDIVSIVIIVVGVLFSWVFSLVLSAFGELVESSKATSINTEESWRVLKAINVHLTHNQLTKK